MKLVKAVYEATSGYPGDEKYGLTSPSRRAAVSIPSNISEGWARNTSGEFKQFLGIALGSNAELQTLLHLARDLSTLPAAEASLLLESAGRLRSLILKFKSRMP